MDDKLKIFWNLDVLVKMCRSKSDGPSLRIEEKEIEDKINSYNQEKEEITQQSEEESYDTSAEMADRNIEIITKKTLQTLKNQLKEKNKELNEYKEEEERLHNNTSMLRESNESIEKYLLSMQERIHDCTDQETIDRYNYLITEAENKQKQAAEDMQTKLKSYDEIQTAILNITEEIEILEDKISKKKKLLDETEANLENKENYIDKSKKEKNNKRIKELDSKIEKLTHRLEIIREDPKYIETKIKDIINDKEDSEKCRDYLVKLINKAIKEPYINVPTDNALEEELLRATQARDIFANEIDQKTYNILDSNTPEKIRTEYLKERITNWQEELDKLNEQVNAIDKDEIYSYQDKEKELTNMVSSMKEELIEYQKAYDDVPESNIGEKATLKAALDEKNDDIIAAEYIIQSFRKDESNEINHATDILKHECETINQNIKEAFEEIEEIKNRLLSKRSGTIDIAEQNRDKRKLKDLAQTVIDIKHRRQFPETPINIAERLEELLKIDLSDGIDYEFINSTNTIIPKDYNTYANSEHIEVVETAETPKEKTDKKEVKGIKVIEEAEITNPEDLIQSEDSESLSEIGIKEINETYEEEPKLEKEEPKEEIITEPILEDITLEDITLEDKTNEPVVEAKQNVEETLEEIPEEKEETKPESTPVEQPSKEEKEESNDIKDEDLTINSIFNEKNSSQNDEKDDNIITSENLENELDEYIKNLDIQES